MKHGIHLPRGLRQIKLARRVLKRWRDKELATRCRQVELTLTWPAKRLTAVAQKKECGPNVVRGR